jgi:hypothetical protein
MKFFTKSVWLAGAEITDAWRVIPRLLLIGYCFFVFDLTSRLLTWYFTLPAAERSLEASGLGVAVFTAVTGFGTQFLNAYIKSGRKWNGSSNNDASS